jgi:hypothetical protein
MALTTGAWLCAPTKKPRFSHDCCVLRSKPVAKLCSASLFAPSPISRGVASCPIRQQRWFGYDQASLN